MGDLESRAQQDLPALSQWVDDLLALVEEMLNSIRYSEDDHFGFMALCFLSKQDEHMHSIQILIQNGQGRDAELIARAMMEGMCFLLWAAREPSVRAFQWRGYAYVEDWRLMNQRDAVGEPVSPERRATINEFLRMHGDQFRAPRPRQPGQRGNRLSIEDPYYTNWRLGQSISSICEEVEGELLHRELYGPISDWTHWGPPGLGDAIAREGNRVVYLPPPSRKSATALAAGFQSLAQMTEVVDRHLNLGMASRISELRDQYIAWGEARHAGPAHNDPG